MKSRNGRERKKETISTKTTTTTTKTKPCFEDHRPSRPRPKNLSTTSTGVLGLELNIDKRNEPMLLSPLGSYEDSMKKDWERVNHATNNNKKCKSQQQGERGGETRHNNNKVKKTVSVDKRISYSSSDEAINNPNRRNVGKAMKKKVSKISKSFSSSSWRKREKKKKEPNHKKIQHASTTPAKANNNSNNNKAGVKSSPESSVYFDAKSSHSHNEVMTTNHHHRSNSTKQCSSSSSLPYSLNSSVSEEDEINSTIRRDECDWSASASACSDHSGTLITRPYPPDDMFSNTSTISTKFTHTTTTTRRREKSSGKSNNNNNTTTHPHDNNKSSNISASSSVGDVVERVPSLSAYSTSSPLPPGDNMTVGPKPQKTLWNTITHMIHKNMIFCNGRNDSVLPSSSSVCMYGNKTQTTPAASAVMLAKQDTHKKSSSIHKSPATKTTISTSQTDTMLSSSSSFDRRTNSNFSSEYTNGRYGRRTTRPHQPSYESQSFSHLTTGSTATTSAGPVKKKTFHRMNTEYTPSTVSASTFNTMDSSQYYEENNKNNKQSSRHTHTHTHDSRNMKVAIVNRSRGHIKLTSISTEPGKIADSYFKGYDGKRCHYAVVDPNASASTGETMMEKDCRNDVENKVSDKTRWRDAVVMDNEERDGPVEVCETQAVLHIEKKDTKEKERNVNEKHNGGGSSLLSSIRNAAQYMTLSPTTTKNQKHKQKKNPNPNPDKTLEALGKNEKMMIHDFLDCESGCHSRTSNSDKLSYSTGSSSSSYRNHTNNYSSSHQPQLSVPRHTNNHNRGHRSQISTTSALTNSSLHRRRRTEVTLTDDQLSEICDDSEYDYFHRKKQKSVAASSVSRKQGPPPKPATAVIKKQSNRLGATTFQKNKELHSNNNNNNKRHPKNKDLIIGPQRKFFQEKNKTNKKGTLLSEEESDNNTNTTKQQFHDYEKGNYIPTCSHFEKWLKSKRLQNKCIFEGWVGFYAGEEDALNRLKGHKVFRRGDIRYILILSFSSKLIMHVFSSPEDSASAGGASGTQQATGERGSSVMNLKLDLSSDTISAENLMISKRKGSCVVIKDNNVPLCYIIPVYLPAPFFTNASRSRLVNEKRFEKFQRVILKLSYGTKKKQKKQKTNSNSSEEELGWGDSAFMLRLASSDQYDSVLHLMFVLSTAIKQRSSRARTTFMPELERVVELPY